MVWALMAIGGAKPSFYARTEEPEATGAQAKAIEQEAQKLRPLFAHLFSVHVPSDSFNFLFL